MLRYSLVLLLILFAWPVQAASGENARQFVDDMGKRVIETLNSQSPEPQKQQQLRQMFSDNVDTEWMARFALGNHWSRVPQEQRDRYLQTYRNYLLTKYTTNFAEYAGSDYTITGVKPEADGYTVGMEVKSPGAKDQNVLAGYRVHTASNGALKVSDIIVEGVSLITTQRSEFASVMQSDGIDKLIQQLQEKTQS